MTTVAVVTPWVDHLELVDDYFEAIEGADQVIVVDNGSGPPLDFAAVRNETNRGFAAGCNLGLEKVTADVVVFLNNDVALGEPDWLEAFRDGVEPGYLCGPIRDEIHAAVDDVSFPYVDGWCLSGTTDDVNALGGFDEGYLSPGDFTDNDLCLRARAEGMSLREIRPKLRHKLAQTAGHRHEIPGGLEAFAANQERYRDLARRLMKGEPAHV
jgi:GT2 family glycosyltransferase